VQVNKQKEEVILDHLHETAFQGTGLGRTILGPEVRLAVPIDYFSWCLLIKRLLNHAPSILFTIKQQAAASRFNLPHGHVAILGRCMSITAT
jgi:hypothetical protein